MLYCTGSCVTDTVQACCGAFAPENASANVTDSCLVCHSPVSHVVCAGIVEPVFAEYISNLTETAAGLDAADKGVAAGAKVSNV